MTHNKFYAPGNYESPLTPEGRARTIASFQICCAPQELAKDVPMRRDVLRNLMSPRAVSYWLELGWLKKIGKVGKVELLVLSSKGLVTCKNSLAGGSEVPTTKALVDRCVTQMTVGSTGFKEISFAPLEDVK